MTISYPENLLVSRGYIVEVLNVQNQNKCLNLRKTEVPILFSLKVIYKFTKPNEIMEKVRASGEVKKCYQHVSQATATYIAEL